MTVITFKVPITSSATFEFADFKDALETEFEAQVSKVVAQVFTVRIADSDAPKVIRAAKQTPFIYASSERE